MARSASPSVPCSEAAEPCRALGHARRGPAAGPPPARARRRLSGLALAGGLLLAGGCGGSGHSSSTAASTAGATSAPQHAAQSTSVAGDTVTATSQGVTATMHAASHDPRVGRIWPVQFTVTSAGRPARASVSYEFLYGGQVVAHRSHYVFTGHFDDTFKWPASSVGYPLTLRAVVVSEGRTINLDYPVQVGA